MGNGTFAECEQTLQFRESGTAASSSTIASESKHVLLGFTEKLSTTD